MHLPLILKNAGKHSIAPGHLLSIIDALCQRETLPEPFFRLLQITATRSDITKIACNEGHVRYISRSFCQFKGAVEVLASDFIFRLHGVNGSKITDDERNRHDMAFLLENRLGLTQVIKRFVILSACGCDDSQDFVASANL